MRTYSYQQLYNQIISVFKKIGLNNSDAQKVTEILLAAELRGINSHGVIRIKDYFQLWQKGRVNSKPDIKITYETPSTAVIDGDSGLGMIVATQAMNVAINKAKNVGTGWVSVNNSNHFGIAGYYSMMALEHDMIGISMTNANSFVAPTFSIDRLLGTNPIAVAIPTGKENPFIADFATTPIPRGKLVVMHKKGEKAPIGYVQDKDGQASTDPNILTEGGAILPLGGDRLHGSHKGYCLGAIVDIFSGVLSGANYGPFVPPLVSYLPVKDNLPGKGTGHFFGAIRIDAFQPADEFKKHIDKWIQTFKNAKPAKGQERVYVPGEPEREMEEKLKKDGIPVLDKILEELKEVCQELDVKFELL
ncbi:MAG: Ldh family oxidoreductase [Bacteroidales bacterium]|nr:Ldh family oxidoreductase [Bacteroidales bacterium]